MVHKLTFSRKEKDGEIEISCDAMKKKDTIYWNVMIFGYGMNGDAESAIEIFKGAVKCRTE